MKSTARIIGFVCLKISYAGRETLYSDDVKGGIVDISGQQQEVIA